MTRTILFFLVSVAMMAQGEFRGAGRYEIYSPLSRKVLDMDRRAGVDFIWITLQGIPKRTFRLSKEGIPATALYGTVTTMQRGWPAQNRSPVCQGRAPVKVGGLSTGTESPRTRRESPDDQNQGVPGSK